MGDSANQTARSRVPGTGAAIEAGRHGLARKGEMMVKKRVVPVVKLPALAAELIVANAPDPVFVCDLKGKILVANNAVSQLLGLRRDELLEQSLSRFLSTTETSEFLAAVREVVERGVTRNVRLGPRGASGEPIPASLNAAALRDRAGHVIGVIGILRDMRELDKARAYAESLIKHAPDPVFVSDLDGKILQANDAVFNLLGFRSDELIEQSLSRIITPEETREFVLALREVVERGATRNARLHPRSASGEIIPTTLNASALRDPEGHVIGVIGILRDMRELDKARRYAESLIKDAPDPVFVTDLQGKILQANDAVSELLGFQEDEVVEQSLSRFLSPPETREFIAALREIVERGVTRNVRLTPRSASGEIIPTMLNASALRHADGQVTGAIGILRDMRAYDQVVRALEQSRQELQAADEAKDRFLAMVSHELRTPLTAMLGWARMLRGRVLDEATAARALDVIERNTTLQAKLIDDLLDLSRIITGKLQLELRPVDPVGIVQAAIEALQALADAKDIVLKVVLDSSAGPIMGDPQRLQQVVWNLLSNAMKFTPQHGVVELNLAQADRTARITVRDSGCGISPDLLPHLFEPFHQGKEARRLGGLGLGLAIVQQIVGLHGGSVRAESAGDGQGATFIVELPVSVVGLDGDAERMRNSDTQHGTAPAFASLPGVHVLIVEDEADARELLVAILQRAGADVFAVASSVEALRTLNQWRAEILVSDIGLPDEDGYALIHKVRELDPDHGGAIPAIALTANARVEDRARALAAGFQQHMAKPVDPAELTRAIAQIVDLRSC
jgi:PAS domain S-box-containing protein